ncbi:MAG: acyl-CoA dehydrogenase family protein [Sheuella sp.]|nr:acyl-CoA dehydrogenase family protein [Sheuella sp.]
MYPEPEYSRPWLKLLAQKGWSVPLWPKEWGGTGWSPLERFIFEHECAQAGAPLVHPMGVRLVGPVILRFGTQEQKQEYLPPIARGDNYWCQGFSEPGAGSDLASLRLQAVREGDHDVNEVFFDDVRVPIRQRIGAEGQGWDCAKYLLEFERGAGIYSPRLRSGFKRVGLMLQTLDSKTDSIHSKAQLVRKFGEVSTDLDTFEMLELQTLMSIGSSASLGDVSYILKLRASRLKQSIGDLGVVAMGEQALRWTPGPARLQTADELQLLTQTVLGDYLNSRAYTIFGGASEIQLGIIARAACTTD